jgi:hypothetical protein
VGELVGFVNVTAVVLVFNWTFGDHLEIHLWRVAKPEFEVKGIKK